MNSKIYSLILGGTHGLGAEIHAILKSENKPAIIVGRSAKHCAENDIAIQCDLGSEESVRNLLLELDQLVLSGAVIQDFFWVSGIIERAKFESISPEQILKLVDVNFRNPLLVAQWAWCHMQAAGGRFVVVSSSAGISDSPKGDEAVYAATKSAEVSFARAIGKNRQNAWLKVALVCPGGMKTGFWEHQSMPKEIFDSFLDPAKVAQRIISLTAEQSQSYQEIMIPRGSL